MLELLAFYTSLCIAAAPPSSRTAERPQEVAAAIDVPRVKTAALPEGALAWFGDNRFTTLQPLEAIEFVDGGKELQGWDGRTLHRWEFPSGRPLGQLSLPPSVNPTGHPFAYTALSPQHA